MAEIPGDPEEVYWVESIEFGNGINSHHLVVEAAKEGSPAEAALEARELGVPIPCIGIQTEFGPGFEYIGFSAAPRRAFDYPAGVGRKFRGKQRFVFDYHYFNSTDHEVQARSALNFHTTTESNVRHLAQFFTFSNVTIDTPPGTRASFTAECRVSSDLKVLELTRHTHRWGRDYEAFFAGGPRNGERIFESTAYDQDIDHIFDAPLDVKAGEGFRFRCDFENTEAYPLRYGPNARDEMCALFGLWYSESSNDPPPENCITTQIDAEGVARPSEEIARPKPSSQEVAACLEVAAVATTQTAACSTCSCQNCADLLGRCAKDGDCIAILQCVYTTGCQGIECAASCQTAINEHSRGGALALQLGECVSSLCPVCGM